MDENRVTPERIHQLGFAFAPPLILEAAIEVGVFDRLEQRALSLEELVEESRRYLVSTNPDFQGGLFRHLSRQLLPNWLHLVEAVRTGKPPTRVNREEVGGEFFRQFVEDLFPRGYGAAQALADALGIGEATEPVRVLDVAAGSGVWSIAMAEKSPQVQVTVVDWPAVIPVTQKVAARRGVADRYQFVAGDLLEVDFGGGYRVATLGHILHSEGAQRSRTLLRKVFDALVPGGTVAIAEMVPNDARTGPAHALIFAVNMLVHTEQGDTFSFAEIGEWLRGVGFTNVRQLDAPAPSPLILAEKR
jgi:2-polyprenyl-3-methyl-5-hydroxy-6-metoxy-1,4-benzoquinol methylase